MAVISHLAPTPEEKRIIPLDILRGFAVIGIFVVNIQIMNCHFVHRDLCYAGLTEPLDESVSIFIKIFFVHKFLAIFSFLFGVGLALQVYKQIQRNTFNLNFLIRRMTGLFILGLLHVLLFWSGDVLHIYAILGLFLIFLLRKSDKFMIVTALIVLFFPFYHPLFNVISEILHFNYFPKIENYSHEQLLAINLHGSYFDTMKLRISEFIYNIGRIYNGLIPRAFFMFVTGAWLVKKKVIANLNQFANDIKSKMVPAFIISFSFLILLYFVIQPNMHLISNPSLDLLKRGIYRINRILYYLSNLVIAMFYVWFIVWSLKFQIAQIIFGPLRYIGQMALTNYIMHSAIAIIIFTSAGFQLYGSMRSSTGIIIVVFITIFQILFSKLWLKYFRFGPLEWVWRCFSYMKLLPISRGAINRTNPYHSVTT